MEHLEQLFSTGIWRLEVLNRDGLYTVRVNYRGGRESHYYGRSFAEILATIISGR